MNRLVRDPEDRPVGIIAAASTSFVDIHEERIELATQFEACVDELVRLRRPLRVISVGQDNPHD